MQSGTPPALPDYKGLAEQTTASQAAATQGQTVANRPNQIDQYGNTVTWAQGPSGQWTQSTQLGQQGQQALDQQNQMRTGLLGQAGAATANPLDPSQWQGVDFSKLNGAGQFNMDPTGNSKAIQDATYGLLAPQRDQARASEVQRLKNQGLTEDSPAFQRAMARLGSDDTDAQLKSLLAGQAEYGNAFNRGLNASNQNFGQNLQQQTFAQQLRDKQMGEAQTLRQQPLSDLKGLMDSSAFYKPEFSSFVGAGNPGGTDYLTAGQNLFASQQNQYNANQLNRSNMIGGVMDLGGDFLNSAAGQSLLSSAGNWLGGLFSGGQ
jgi:hypothetical protein